MERRLAAILAADLVGYSSLMEADEDGTHDRLRTCIATIFEPTITKFSGRIIKLMGDGVLAEFPSVLAAVTCAMRLQALLAERNDQVGAADRLTYRMGINLGDVIVDQGDLYGDGVNVAARVEALAPPGQVCVTRPVRDQVRDRLEYFLEDWGDLEVKNRARPVRIFRVVADPVEAAKLRANLKASQRRRGRWALAAVCAAGAVLAEGALTGRYTPPPIEDPEIALGSTPATPTTTDLNAPDAAALPPLRTVEVEPEEPDPVEAIETIEARLTPPEQPPPEPGRETLWVDISIDATSGFWTDCVVFNSGQAHSLPVGTGNAWVPVTLINDPGLDLMARAEISGEQATIRVWPFSQDWAAEDALQIELGGIDPGQGGLAYSNRRGEPPIDRCGPFTVYVRLTDPPE